MADQKPMKFRLKDGAPFYMKDPANPKKKYKVTPGQVVEHTTDLTLVFKDRFDRVPDGTPATKKSKLTLMRSIHPAFVRQNTSSPPTPLNRNPKTINANEFRDRRELLPEKTDDEEEDEEVNKAKEEEWGSDEDYNPDLSAEASPVIDRDEEEGDEEAVNEDVEEQGSVKKLAGTGRGAEDEESEDDEEGDDESEEEDEPEEKPAPKKAASKPAAATGKPKAGAAKPGKPVGKKGK